MCKISPTVIGISLHPQDRQVPIHISRLYQEISKKLVFDRSNSQKPQGYCEQLSDPSLTLDRKGFGCCVIKLGLGLTFHTSLIQLTEKISSICKFLAQQKGY